MTPASDAGARRAGRVLRLALLAWGLGHLALGRRGAGIAWLLAEVLSAILVAWLFAGLSGTSGYLLPFVAGCIFIGAWAAQAVLAYRGARASGGAIGPAPVGSPAAAIVWLTVPLLIWGTTFWLVGGGSSSPASVLDAFETAWPELVEGGSVPSSIVVDQQTATQTALAALATLRASCAAVGDEGCDDSATLLRNIRITLTAETDTEATAVARTVRFERRPTTVLWFISGSELVPVPQRTVLTFQLRASAAKLPGGLDVGARRWQIVGMEESSASSG